MGFWMGLAAGSAWVQLMCAILILVPFIGYRLAVAAWARRGLPLLPDLPEEGLGPDVGGLPNITVVLPTWNEGLIIEGKLKDIAAQDYPVDRIEVIIIDAGSDDDTLELARDWLRRRGNKARFAAAVQFIEEGERKGKSVSINTAFAAARPESSVVMMSDVDCRLAPGALLRVGRRFLDPTIGAVTGRQALLTSYSSLQAAQESTYRDAFFAFRHGESCRDSTPVFHGECAAYRRTAIAEHRLVERANADDSQLAVIVRKFAGERALWDADLVFTEVTPPDDEAQQVQKVRRAQGLVRHFWRNRDTCFRPRYGAFGVIMGTEAHLHIVAPWLMLLGFATGFLSLSATMADGAFWDPSGLPVPLAILFLVDMGVLLLLGFGLLRLPVPLSRLALTFSSFMLILASAQIRLARGQSLHRWAQVTSVRERLATLEAEK